MNVSNIASSGERTLLAKQDESTTDLAQKTDDVVQRHLNLDRSGSLGLQAHDRLRSLSLSLQETEEKQSSTRKTDLTFLQELEEFIPNLKGAEDLGNYLPMTIEALERLVENAIANFEKKLAEFLAIATEERTFENTIQAWSLISGAMVIAEQQCHSQVLIHRSQDVRDAAREAEEKIQKTVSSAYKNHPEIYSSCKLPSTATTSNEAGEFYHNHLLTQLEREGFGHNDADRIEIIELKEECVSLGATFRKQIQEDSPSIFVSREELSSMSQTWLEENPVNEEGEVKLTLDPSSYGPVLYDCLNSKIRGDAYNLFWNRGYPKSAETLRQLIEKEQELAQRMGYPNYACYDFVTDMTQTPESAMAFIDELCVRLRDPAAKELEKMVALLPEGVTLSQPGKLAFSDYPRVSQEYIKENFSVDANEISRFFPMETTLANLFKIYEEFFGITIREVPPPATAVAEIPELRAVEIYDSSGCLRSVVLLDLFFHPDKRDGIFYSPILPAISSSNGEVRSASGIIVTGFTLPTGDTPSFWNHSEVVDFFHEFGHAIHDLFGSSPFIALCGIATKYDFGELPSRMLEQFMWEPQILKRVSSHYETKEPLSDEQIKSMIDADQCEMAYNLQWNCLLGKLFLSLFQEKIEDLTQHVHDLQREIMPQLLFREDCLMYPSFRSLASYGPKYYSYLWSQVVATDLLERIREKGNGNLLDPKVGHDYVEKLLSRGGGCHPNEMLEGFLGREPSSAPFFERFFKS